MLLNLLRFLNHCFTLAMIIFIALGYTISFFFPSTITTWDSILVFASLLAFPLTYWVEGNPLAKTESDLGLKALGLSMLPLLIFLPAFITLLGNVEAQMYRHSDLYGAYVQAIMQGTGQPDNVYVLGAQANYPWLYHALVASLSHLLQMPHPYVRSILAILTFLSTLGWASESLTYLLSNKYSPLFLSILACFVLLGINLLGFTHSMVDIWDNFNIWKFFELIAPITFIENQRLQNGVLGKYIAYTTTSGGFLYTWLCIYAALRFIKTKEMAISIFWFLIGVAGSIAYLLAGGVYIPAALLCGYIVVLIYFALFQTSELKTYLFPRFTRKDLGFMLLGLLLFLPLASYLLATRSSATGAIRLSLINFDNWFMLFGSFYALFPLVLIVAVLAWIERNPSYILLLFASLAALLACAFTEIVTEPYGGNEYKFALFSTFLMTMTAVPALERLHLNIKDKEGKDHLISFTKPVILLIFLCLTINIFGISARLQNLYSVWTAQRGYYYNGTSIESRFEEYQDVFSWLRTETSPETVLILPLTKTYHAFLLSERMPYVSNSEYGLGISESLYEPFSQTIEQLYSLNPADNLWQESFERIVATSEARPLALIVPNELAWLDADLQNLGLEMGFQARVASIYIYIP